MKKHRLNIFPEMQKHDFEKLENDLKQNGFDPKYQIWIYENEILDGWNRYNICSKLNIPFIKKEFIGSEEDALKFVLRSNHRRNLSSSQWAVIAVESEDVVRKIKEKARNNLKTKQPLEQIPKARLPIHASKNIANIFNTNEKYVREAEKIKKEKPDIFQEIKEGKKTITEAQKQIKFDVKLQERKKIAEKGENVLKSEKWNIYHSSIETWVTNKKYDFIITDPPYLKEYLRLYGILGEKSNLWLKDGGLLIAMCGQSYLDEIYKMLSDHLDYYWTGCYLTLGVPTPLRHVNVNTTWKPLLIFKKRKTKYTGKIFGDVFKSDKKEKDFHKWGQSESGMFDIISKICLQGQHILDPFCGAGTTGIAAIKHGCFFDGLEIEIENVNISKARLNDKEKN